MKPFLLLALLFQVMLYSVVVVAPAHAEIQTISEAINKAGRQRMLTQRIVRAYAQIGINFRQEKSRQMLNDALSLYARQLDELNAYVTSAESKKRIESVNKLWPSFKNLASAKVTKNDAEELQTKGESLLKASHQLVLSLEAESGSSAGRLVNIAGRQRMLSQRMTKYFMLQEWGIEAGDIDKAMATSMEEFEAAMQEMSAHAGNTAKINAALVRADKLFKQYQKMLTLKGKGKLVKVADNADKLLKYMNITTGLYEKLGSSS